ncbi:uncharacterized protein LOC132203053 isoform X1 [Neocloeon triangulifer]|uniref:uncharacterized protein LOC132203053 isoform X1 n=1 Tax=Neocloeon triangulifer TaxID=2078957 RepID=UPI00286F3401|nr:uncharacterized protein LOC132203053 isoform X1 [Neocloeon triangulifer]
MSERFSRRSIVLGRRGSSYTGLQGPATPSHFPSHLINAEPSKLIAEINTQVATFRDLLIHIGHHTKDGPEMRERIRKLRRQCVEAFKHSVTVILPQIRSDVAEGIPVDNQHFILLFMCTQLFLRELIKCRRLVQVIPMDMSGYYENRPGPSNMGNLISQLLLCKTITPDFNQEELASIKKDSEEINGLIADMQEYMPQQQQDTISQGRQLGLGGDEVVSKWSKRRRRSSLYRSMGSFCCLCKPNYL